MPSYYILVADGYWDDVLAEYSFRKDRCIHKTDHKRVADETCKALQDRFPWKGKAGPAFFAVPADDLKTHECANFEVYLEELDRYSGPADEHHDYNQTSRDAAYHRHAVKLEEATRKRLGLPKSAAPAPPAKAKHDQQDEQAAGAAGISAAPADQSSKNAVTPKPPAPK